MPSPEIGSQEGRGDARTEGQDKAISTLENKLAIGEELSDQEIAALEVARDAQNSRETGMVLYEGIRDITAQQRGLAKKFRDKGDAGYAETLEANHPELKKLSADTLARLKERQNFARILGTLDWKGMDRIYTGKLNFRSKGNVTNPDELCAALKAHVLDVYNLELTAAPERSQRLQSLVGKPQRSSVDKKDHPATAEWVAVEIDFKAAENYQQHQLRAIETLRGFQQAAREAGEENIVALVDQTLADIEQEKELVAHEVAVGAKE